MDARLGEVLAAGGPAVFFGGAGVSTQSGIPDFRSAQGLYSRSSRTTYAPEQVLSHSFFIARPDEFFAFYRANLLHPAARPNPAHLGLAALERAGRLSAVITQNIDGLHQQAGSRTVLELHGSVHRNYCLGCGRQYAMDFMLVSSGVPTCLDCSMIVRPDVVLYEESLDHDLLARAARAVSQADTLIIGGTSLAVFPAAGLIHAFQGRHLVLINRDPTPADRLATVVIRAPIGQALAPD